MISNEIIIFVALGAGILLVAFCVKIDAKRKKERAEKIRYQVERIQRANEPGHRPNDGMGHYFQDGATVYRKMKKGEEKRKV